MFKYSNKAQDDFKTKKDELPEPLLRLKVINVTIVRTEEVTLGPKQMEMLFKVMRKGSLYYLLELGSRLRSLMNKKKANIVAICFPTTKNPYSEKALREVAKKEGFKWTG
jgi:hypothetical protein